MTIDQEFTAALQMHQSGQIPQAVNALEELLHRAPDHAEALYSLGVILLQCGKPAEASECINRFIRLKPNDGEAYVHLGNAMRERGLLDQAIAAYLGAVELLPDVARNHNNLAAAMIKAGRVEESIPVLMRATQLDPQDANATMNLGIAMAKLGRHDQAIPAYRQATQLMPTNAEVFASLGRSLHIQGHFDQAISASQRALQIKPRLVKAFITLALSHRAQMRFTESNLACESAIQIDPNQADAHWILSLNLLVLGDIPRGWSEYEWRLKAFPTQKTFTQPQWQGENPDGRTILLHAEQGFGDTLHFIRYAPLISARGGIVLLQCQPELVPLLSRMDSITKIYTDTDNLPSFDLHCPMMSLPFAFATSLASIPGSIPYLTADPHAQAAFHSANFASNPKLKVGLVWAGRPTHANDRNRSMPLSTLAPLTALAGVTFYSLQKGDAAAELNSLSNRRNIVDLTDRLTDFDKTAAAVAALDLVVTVDTSMAHLCGALGIPVWILIPFAPDWRWLLDRNDSPWYPTARLFRQNAPGQWPSVIERVANALTEISNPKKHLKAVHRVPK